VTHGFGFAEARSEMVGMPYIHLTCPALDPGRRQEIATALTEAVVELFTPPRGPGPDHTRARTTVHLSPYGLNELFVGSHAASLRAPMSPLRSSLRRRERSRPVPSTRGGCMSNRPRTSAYRLRVWRAAASRVVLIGELCGLTTMRAADCRPTGSCDRPGWRALRGGRRPPV